MKYKKIPKCKTCGQHFDNIFEATDHIVEDGGKEIFDPKLMLSNGYVLMIGSLLRCLYGYANKPSAIKEITQAAYAALYASESNPAEMESFIEDMIISENMTNIDEEIIALLDDKKPNNEEDRK